MVNYLYVLGDIEKNHEAFAERGRIAGSSGVLKAQSFPPNREVVPVS